MSQQPIDKPTQPTSGADTDCNKPDYWNAIYAQEVNPRWDLGTFAPPLQQWLQSPAAPRAGRVLVPGCGFGHDARLFALRGMHATGVDFAALAIEGARKLHGDVPNLEFLQQDIFQLMPKAAASFDLAYEYTCFVAIDPARRAEYARLLHDVLKPRGLLIGCFYNHGRPGGPPFDATRQAVLEAFAPLFTIEKLEVSPHSIERRQGHELWAEFRRP